MKKYTVTKQQKQKPIDGYNQVHKKYKKLLYKNSLTKHKDTNI